MDDPLDRVPPNGLVCRDCWLDLSQGAVVMGILNITPDSFYDGGQYETVSQALTHAEAMVSEGARIIDVGGASSRPRGAVYGAGAMPVPEDVEIQRIVPVIEAIHDALPDTIISVDTFHPVVAKAALDAGAHMINDISGLTHGTRSAEYTAQVNAAYVVMHSVANQSHLVHTSDYTDVVTQVYQMLAASSKRAKDAGVQSVVIDPGFGFGKQHRDNLKLIHQLNRFAALSYPILVGISRKSTVGMVLSHDDQPAPVSDRLYGSLGMAAVAIIQGAHLIRTHDVRATVEMIRGMEAILECGE